MNCTCYASCFALIECVWSILAPNGHAELFTYVDEDILRF